MFNSVYYNYQATQNMDWSNLDWTLIYKLYFFFINLQLNQKIFFPSQNHCKIPSSSCELTVRYVVLLLC